MPSNLLAQAAPAAPGISGTGNAGVDLTNYLVLSNGKKVSDVFKTPADMINLLVSNAFVIAGIYVMVLIILGGYKFFHDETKGKQEAQTLWTQGGIGLVTMFAAYWIVQIYQVMTGQKVFF